VLASRASAETTIPLSRARVDVVLLLDRSGSMQQPIDEDDPESATRWEALTLALAQALASVDPEIDVGAKLYPDETPDGSFDPAALCSASPRLTIAPSPASVGRIVERMRSAMPPRGGTPTAEAISVALTELSGSRLSRHAIVLVTDGAPNCNAALEGQLTCVCSTDPRKCAGAANGLLCLDDARTLDTIDRAAAAGVPVIVVGIDDPSRPELGDVLDRMAIAGGHPRPEGSGRRFHSARSAAELEAALALIGSGLGACTFVPDGAGVLGGDIVLEIGGMPVPQSPTEGWTLAPIATNAIELHGTYCELALRPDRQVVARIRLPLTEPITVDTFAP
jgi:hypothetical protein